MPPYAILWRSQGFQFPFMNLGSSSLSNLGSSSPLDIGSSTPLRQDQRPTLQQLDWQRPWGDCYRLLPWLAMSLGDAVGCCQGKRRPWRRCCCFRDQAVPIGALALQPLPRLRSAHWGYCQAVPQADARRFCGKAGPQGALSLLSLSQLAGSAHRAIATASSAHGRATIATAAGRARDGTAMARSAQERRYHWCHIPAGFYRATPWARPGFRASLIIIIFVMLVASLNNY